MVLVGSAAAAVIALVIRSKRRNAAEREALAAALAREAPEDGGERMCSIEYVRRGWWRAVPPRPTTRTCAITLRDGRGFATLDDHGARVAAFPALLDGSVDGFDYDAVSTLLFPAAERLLERETGCARAICFDHIARRCDSSTVSDASGPINFASERPRPPPGGALDGWMERPTGPSPVGTTTTASRRASRGAEAS